MIFSPVLANGQQVFPYTGGIQGPVTITLACATYPSAGAATLEYQLTGTSNWVLAVGGPNHTSTLPATAQATWFIFGPIGQFRLTYASLTGGASPLMAVSAMQDQSAPQGVYEGFRAITTQGYTEANIKNGSQFEIGSFMATVAAGAHQDVLFQTGTLPVVIKDRQIATTATLAEFHFYKNPTGVVSSTVIPIYNLTGASNAAATTVSASLVTSVTTVGTEISAPTYVVGTSGGGSIIAGTYASNGNQRVLVPNTQYLGRFINTGSASCAVAIYSTHYEGPLDIPLS
jgi:hypothetical protein